MVAYKDIPEECVRQEWRELMDFFKKKRYPTFGYARSMKECKKLPEYWGSFKNEKDMLMALKCEELVQRCENPFGYAERLEFNPAMANLDFTKIFADLWEAIKDVAENNQVILKGMFDLYSSRFSACIPKKLFDLEWLINDEVVEFYVEDYREALLFLSSADCDVEKMEAEDRVTARLESLKEVIGKNVSLEDEEIDSLIATIV